MRDGVTKWHRLSLAGCKPRISPGFVLFFFVVEVSSVINGQIWLRYPYSWDLLQNTYTLDWGTPEMRWQAYIIIMVADVLAPFGTRPSATTVLTLEWLKNIITSYMVAHTSYHAIWIIHYIKQTMPQRCSEVSNLSISSLLTGLSFYSNNVSCRHSNEQISVLYTMTKATHEGLTLSMITGSPHVNFFLFFFTCKLPAIYKWQNICWFCKPEYTMRVLAQITRFVKQHSPKLLLLAKV